MPISNVDYRPMTRVMVQADRKTYMEISRRTGIPMGKVIQYGDKILKNSMQKTVAQLDTEIDKYMPKATGQIRHSLKHQLHHSGLTNSSLQMKFGTFVKYMKYIANMSETQLRHPKKGTKNLRYKRNAKFGKKGQFRKNPGAWRYVKYFGPARWVKLDDPKAQKNFWSQTLARMKTYLQKEIAKEITATLPSAERKPFTDKLVRGVKRVN